MPVTLNAHARGRTALRNSHVHSKQLLATLSLTGTGPLTKHVGDRSGANEIESLFDRAGYIIIRETNA